MVLNSAVCKEGLGRGKLNPGGLRCRAEQEQQTKRKNGQCFVPPPAREPARRRLGNTSCFFHWPFPMSPAVHFLFLSPFKRPVDAGERRTERWGGGV